MPVSLLNVKSPLWKIVFDRNGHVLEKMTYENDNFTKLKDPYLGGFDISFEFAYNLRKLRIEVKRNNYIYAMQMLEVLRQLTVQIQTLNENKKLHQFKAFHTLNNDFLEAFMACYPTTINTVEIMKATNVLTELFKRVLRSNKSFILDEKLFRIAEL
ncbi:hypothetical protein [Solibacillus daqui]|uniref:hypothetical protein n=1 Tax=Solibacillus daqui TaxID=2912187 RepID=UPI00236629AC|nr:hypothetical protein [Solibacillus daqui]